MPHCYQINQPKSKECSEGYISSILVYDNAVRLWYKQSCIDKQAQTEQNFDEIVHNSYPYS